MLYRYQCPYSKDVLGGGGLCDPYFFLHILSSCVKIRHVPSALKVVVGGVVAKGCRSEKYVPTNYLVNPNL